MTTPTGTILDSISRQCSLAAPARLDCLPVFGAVVRAFCTITTPDALEATNKIALATHEAVMNTVRHTFGGGANVPIRLTIGFADSTYTILLCDNGPAFAPPVPPPHDPAAPREGGYGVLLIRNIMDSVEYSRHEATNCLLLVKKT